jgi:hypothetical protein
MILPGVGGKIAFRLLTDSSWSRQVVIVAPEGTSPLRIFFCPNIRVQLREIKCMELVS